MPTSFEQVLADVDRAYAEGRIDRAEAARRIARQVHAEIGTTRAGLWAIHGPRGDRAIVCLAAWDARAGDFVDAGAQLREREHPAYFAAMARTGLHACADTHADPVTASLLAPYFAPKGIRATIDVSFSLNANLIGLLCCEHAQLRDWLPGEVAAIRRMAALIALHHSRHGLHGGVEHWLQAPLAA
jgi:GAF domain-containing protein